MNAPTTSETPTASPHAESPWPERLGAIAFVVVIGVGYLAVPGDDPWRRIARIGPLGTQAIALLILTPLCVRRRWPARGPEGPTITPPRLRKQLVMLWMIMALGCAVTLLHLMDLYDRLGYAAH